MFSFKAQAKRRTFYETNRTLIWVHLNFKVKIFCWVRRRTQDASNQSTESDHKAFLKNFILNEAKYTLSNKFLIYQFGLSHVKIDVCPRNDRQTFYPSASDGQNLLNEPNRRTQTNLVNFMNLTHQAWCLMKSQAFGLGLRDKILDNREIYQGVRLEHDEI